MAPHFSTKSKLTGNNIELLTLTSPKFISRNYTFCRLGLKHFYWQFLIIMYTIIECTIRLLFETAITVIPFKSYYRIISEYAM